MLCRTSYTLLQADFQKLLEGLKEQLDKQTPDGHPVHAPRVLVVGTCRQSGF